MTSEHLEELESQFSHPKGDYGIKIGEHMHQCNIIMTRLTFQALKIVNNQHILEIGHGNCGHLEELLKQAKNIRYYGLEISETMKTEAENINFSLCQQNLAHFQLYNGNNIPFENETFDSAFAVNVIYFWDNPVDLLNEIHRVLKHKGVLALTYAQKSFMENVPFVQDKFTLYDDRIIQDIVDKTPFQLLSIIGHRDKIKKRNDAILYRKFSVAILQK